MSCGAAIFSVKRKFRRSNIQLQIIGTICLLYFFAEWADQYASLCSCDDCQGNSESIWYLRQLPMQCMLWITYCPNGWHFILLLIELSPELNRLLQQWQIGWHHCRSGCAYFTSGFVWVFAGRLLFLTFGLRNTRPNESACSNPARRGSRLLVRSNSKGRA